MKITGFVLPNHTPAFRIEAPKESPVGRAWGASFAKDAWLFPAYSPFATLVEEDLARMAPRLEWEPDAVALVENSRRHLAAWERAYAKYQGGSPLSLLDGFYAPDFTPYNHQRLGVQRLLHWDRSLLKWDAGVGKTRTGIDGLRLRGQVGRFNKALIVGPPVVLGSWEEDADRCSGGGLHVARWGDTKKARRECAQASIVLATYGQVREARERFLLAEKDLALDPEMRARYKLAPLDPERLAQLQEDLAQPLTQLNFDTIIADESHYMASWSSAQTQAMMALSALARYRYLLTGTLGDDPRKIYGQLFFLAPALVPLAYDAFVDRHVVKAPHDPRQVVGYKLQNEINDRVDRIALRMRKKDCLDLPPVTVQDIYFDLGESQRARYNELVVEMAASSTPQLDYLHTEDEELIQLGRGRTRQDSGPRKLAHAAARSLKLLQVVSGYVSLGGDYSVCDGCGLMPVCVDQRIRPYTKDCQVYPDKVPSEIVRDIENPKLEAGTELVDRLLGEDPTNKIIIWCLFTPELNDWAAHFEKTGTPFFRVDGSTGKKVDEYKRDFREKNDVRVWLGQIKTGIGLNLAAANYMLFYSLPWDPMQYEQAAERFNRPGQYRNMTIYRLLTSDRTWAIDRHVARLLEFKKDVGFTLSEKVACVACDQHAACDKEKVLPFMAGCRYAATAMKPKYKSEVIE